MEYLWIEYFQQEEDDPTDTYTELDENRLERRRVDFYQNGMRFAYGAERGRTEVLSKTPYPEKSSTLNRPGEVEVHVIDRPAFEELWYRSQDWPSGFMEIFG